MLDIANDDVLSKKCYYTHAVLSEQLDDEHPPTKKKPFNTIFAQPFSHTADLIIPDEVYDATRRELEGLADGFCYAKVRMSLGDIITGDFFNHYIKAGDVVMLSEGRRGVDNVFSLREGVLRLDLDRATYERCGLVGKSVRHPGRKHTKERFSVELELRHPAMLHGKRGFERIVRAFRTTLAQPLVWLFHDVRNASQPPTGPILAHGPQPITSRADCLCLRAVLIPALTSTVADIDADPEYGIDVLEWFGLVTLASPRIAATDSIDDFLSRYTVPKPYRPDADANADANAPIVGDVTRLRWRGLIPPAFLLRLWTTVRRSGLCGDDGPRAKTAWMAMCVAGFEGQSYTMLGVGPRDVLSWECR